MDKELPEETADSALTEHLVPLRETKLGATPQGRRIAALRRRFDRLHREGARLQERAAALGVPPVSKCTALDEATVQNPAIRVETLRAALLQVRARLHALETRAQADPLPAAAAARLTALRQQESQLWDGLRLVTREDIPADPA